MKPYFLVLIALAGLVLTGCGSSDLEFKGVAAESGQSTNGGASVGVVATSPNSFSSGSPLPRLSSSNPVDELASPQMVRIEYSFVDGSLGLCSGTVIAPGIVLTAAHCFVGPRNGEIASQIERGILVGNSTAITRASEVIVHPTYREDLTVSAFFNDIAILRVGELPLPALTIATRTALDSNTVLTAYGFGQVEDGSFGTLRSAQVPAAIVTPNHIFSNGLCAGDSGGPLIQFGVDEAGNPTAGIVGVGSSGFTETCGGSEVSLYTNLQNQEVLDFIELYAPGTIS